MVGYDLVVYLWVTCVARLNVGVLFILRPCLMGWYVCCFFVMRACGLDV